MNALIGYTGFIGSSIARQIEFTYYYNTTNIRDINKYMYDIVIAAAPSGNKRKANANPEQDMAMCMKFIDDVSMVRCNKFVLISTVDVFEKTFNNPKLEYCTLAHHGYGWNRRYVERNLEKIFGDKLYIIRLPNLFGKGLKKNVLFDLINNKLYSRLNLADVRQWYNVDSIGKDILKVIKRGYKKVNLVSAPIRIEVIVKRWFKFDPLIMYSNFNNRCLYDTTTGVKNIKYWTSKIRTLLDIRKFILNYHE
jgi:hypothetical protein